MMSNDLQGKAESASEIVSSTADRTGDLSIEKVVLVVDDEASIRMLVCDLLQDFGYRTLDAGHAQKALDIIQSDTRIDLLISDIGLPGEMNGRQLASAARALRASLKVLLMSGYGEDSSRAGAHMESDTIMISKPFSLAQLERQIRGLLDA